MVSNEVKDKTQMRDGDRSFLGISTSQINQPNGTFFFEKLPKELRFMIYQMLISQHHALLISFPLPVRGPLEPRSQTCHHVRNEIKEWSLATPSTCDQLFGLVNPVQTTVAPHFTSVVCMCCSKMRPDFFYQFPEPFNPATKNDMVT
jgi:hypothetical protein